MSRNYLLKTGAKSEVYVTATGLDWVVENRIQDLGSVTCGIFQIYFYDNSFNPNENSKIQNKAKLIKKTI